MKIPPPPPAIILSHTPVNTCRKSFWRATTRACWNLGPGLDIGVSREKWVHARGNNGGLGKRGGKGVGAARGGGGLNEWAGKQGNG